LNTTKARRAKLVAQGAFRVGPCEDSVANAAQRGCVAVVGLRLFEAGGELIGVVEDLLRGTRHGNHLRYLGRAVMAWMMIGPSVLSITPTSRRSPAVSAPTNIMMSPIRTR
jgi:hypothetical protein